VVPGHLSIADFQAVAEFVDARGAELQASDPGRLVEEFEPLFWAALADMDGVQLMKVRTAPAHTRHSTS
jgi:hypothetical protein